jgi:hypothetical protein
MPFTRESLETAVSLWCDPRDRGHREALAKHGHIRGWDVSRVTNMDHLFYGKRSFNDDISGWDVSKVESMVSMFHNASKFNQSLAAWKLSPQILSDPSLRTYLMFAGADAFSSEKPKALAIARRAARTTGVHRGTVHSEQSSLITASLHRRIVASVQPHASMQQCKHASN